MANQKIIGSLCENSAICPPVSAFADRCFPRARIVREAAFREAEGNEDESMHLLEGELELTVGDKTFPLASRRLLGRARA